MLTAIQRVHASKGPWLTNGGYEYNLVLIAAALALVDAGPGALSLDGARSRERTGPGWTLAALVTGVVGAVGAHAAAEAQPAPPVTEDAA
jgi:putative oxidoreductase